MSGKLWITIAAINGFLSVVAGAFGSHLLEKHLDEKLLHAFEVGARYHMYHALALLAVGLLAHQHRSRLLTFSGIGFLIGMIVFSGSLYGYALSGARVLAMITPIGGLFQLAGWVLLAVAGTRLARTG